MSNTSHTEQQINYVSNFQDLVSTPFHGAMNAICWSRTLTGNFAEIVDKVTLNEHIAVLDEEQLRAFVLSEQGQLAREILLQDFEAVESPWRISPA